MTAIKPEELISFLRNNIDPLKDNAYGDGYRASETLIDGLYLPCAIFRNSNTVIDLAIKRFKQEQSGKGIFSKSSGLGYRDIVKVFVTRGNCINDYQIAKIDFTHHAFPLEILKKIKGETKMGWTGFLAKMKDGKQFAFGTSFSFDFFDMPTGYTPNDITEIINHSYLDKDNKIKSYHSPDFWNEFNKDMVYREKPYFECFVDDL